MTDLNIRDEVAAIRIAQAAFADMLRDLQTKCPHRDGMARRGDRYVCVDCEYVFGEGE
jgi:hypothetical protein